MHFVSRFKASPQEFPSRGMWFSGDLGTKPDVNLHMSMEYRNALPRETWKLVSSLKPTYIFEMSHQMCTSASAIQTVKPSNISVLLSHHSKIFREAFEENQFMQRVFKAIVASLSNLGKDGSAPTPCFWEHWLRPTTSNMPWKKHPNKATKTIASF